MIDACPVCESDRRSEVLSLLQLPVLINAQVSPDEALDVPRGDIELVVCHGCGHLYNRAFDDSLLDYDAAYENTLHYSHAFRDFASNLASRLVSDHGLHGGSAGELGSGPGHFLAMLCDAGMGSASGFDPSYDPERLGAPEHHAVTVTSEPYPADGSLRVDLALSQHVLEHLDDPVDALRTLRRSVGDDGVVYSEVPNGQLMIDHCALWDLIYEHLSYFVPTSLAETHRRAGLEIIADGAEFGEQFMWATARPASVDGADAVGQDGAVDVAGAVAFGETARRRIDDARVELGSMAAAGPVVLWGAGSKGMTYLNLVDVDHRIAGVIDVNPRKAGAGVPGTRHRIDGIEALARLRPSSVLIANPVYRDEIAATVADHGIDAHIATMWT